MIARRLLFVVGLPILIFAGWLSIDTHLALKLSSAIRLSLALAVVIAYLPGTVRLLLAPTPMTGEDYLAVGITWSWLGGVAASSWWVTYQVVGQPSWMTNSKIVLVQVTCAMVAATFHLAAPSAIHKVVPTQSWIKIGLMAAAAVLAVLLASHIAGAGPVD